MRGTAIWGVVKADAYGHGAVIVARELERQGIHGLAVARIGEAIELRRAGIQSRVLVLGGVEGCRELAEAVRWGVAPVLARLRDIDDWSAWHGRNVGAQGAPLNVVVELDTGMARSGLPLEQWPAGLHAIRATAGLELVGVMSHLAESELPASAFNAEQEDRFGAAIRHLDESERGRVEVHLLSSSGAVRRDTRRWDAVRIGGALYGLDLASTRDRQGAGLLPVMSVRAPIADLRWAPTGTGVGYRRLWRAPRDARIALVAAGYGDGFSTAYGGGDALVGGVRCPIVGQISMDSLSIDVTSVGDVAIGDECVLLGAQRSEEIDVTELASRAGIAAYEVWCGLGLRLPRVATGRDGDP